MFFEKTGIFMKAITTTQMREASFRSVRETRFGVWESLFWLSLILILVLVSLKAYLPSGPQFQELNRRIVWEKYQTNLVAFIGLSYGSTLVAASLRLIGAEWRSPIIRIADATALVTLIVGFLFAAINSSRSKCLWESFPPETKGSLPFFWDLTIIFLYLLFTGVFVYLSLIPDLAMARAQMGNSMGRLRFWFYTKLSWGWEDTAKRRQALKSAISTLALGLIVVAIVAFSRLSWALAVTLKKGWPSAILSPYLVVDALYSGVAAVILMVMVFRKLYHLEGFIKIKHFQNLSYMLLAPGLLYLFLIFVDFLTGGAVVTVGKADQVKGGFQPLFWLIVLSSGVLPMILVLWPKTRTILGITAASAMIMGSFWLKQSAQAPLFLGAMVMSLILLHLFFRAFPIMSVWEIEP